MSEMLNRVTQAIHDLEEYALTTDDCRKIARAVIEAMREPTEAMLDYAWPQLTAAKSGHFKDPGRHFWRAAVAAALK